jgi:hypothetical protein
MKSMMTCSANIDPTTAAPRELESTILTSAG